ncbi:unnamed protein product [Microthlaspi erraticum]|uniref:Uncharacterized protein n=1 Tax=Microthlaspi erraticum TaxID=1685480 RepID=A0A6D2IST8_9BRAS|nr:unnamed protein product [Microthlaspi erraticum]
MIANRGNILTGILERFDESIKKRSYNQKSEDCPDGSIENQRPTAQSGWPRNERFTLGQISSVRLKSRPKSKTVRPITHHDPGNKSRGRPRHNRSRQPRTTMPREPGNKPRGRATCLAYHGRCAVRAGNYVPRPAENSSANLHPSDHSGRPRIRPATTVPIVLAAMTRSSGRSSRPTVPTPRSTRSPF